MTDLKLLLDLQKHDTTIDQLEHRRAGLPERDEIEQLATRDTELEQELAAIDERRHTVGRDQKRHEDEVAGLEERVATNEKTMYSGSITSPKELEALQSEIGTLGRRRSEIEDSILELMELNESLVADEQRLTAERGALSARVDELRSVVATTEAEIDGDLEQERGERDRIGSQVPTELRAEYEHLRKSSTTVAVARLSGATCESCHLTLPSVEVDRIRKLSADTPVNCMECGALLVHG